MHGFKGEPLCRFITILVTLKMRYEVFMFMMKVSYKHLKEIRLSFFTEKS